MKTTKHLLFALFGLVACAYVITSCNDDFSEDDLLQRQIELGNEQDSSQTTNDVDALNQAGAFYSLVVTVLDEETPVEGVSVTLQAQSSASDTTGSTLPSRTVTTDATGSAVFDAAVAGSSVVTISGTGYVTATSILDLPQVTQGENYQIINGQVIPLRKNASAILPIFANDPASGKTATINGTVQIETDVTNLTPEFPQNLTIQANVEVPFNELARDVTVVRYTFDGESNFGSATVNGTDGSFSLAVPAAAAGVDIELIFPTITTNQRIAVFAIDGQELPAPAGEFPRPEYRDIPTTFGPDESADGIPFIVGAVANFDAPPAAATGFALDNFQRVGRSLTTGVFNMADFTVPGELFGTGVDDIIVQVTNLGSGYTNSPQFLINDPTGTEAGGQAHIEFAIDGLTVTEAGVGLPANTGVFFDLVYESPFNTFDAGVLDVDTSGTITNISFALEIGTDAAGEITQDAVNAALTDAIDNALTGFDPENLRQISDWVANLRLRSQLGTTPAEVAVTSMAVSRVYQFGITEAGNDNYTDPSFTFTGGGGTTQANINVVEFGTRWSFDVNNSGNTGEYTTLPNMYFEFLPVQTGGRSFISTEGNGNDDVTDFPDFGTDLDLNDILIVSGGDIVLEDAILTYVTDDFSNIPPNFVIVDQSTQRAVASVDFDGETGQLEGDGIQSVFEFGTGYTGPFGVSIEPSATGAPGSGGVVRLNGGSFDANGEFDWTGASELISEGSGYLNQLNLQNNLTGADPFSGDRFFTVRPGDVITRTFDYGTGDKSQDVNFSFSFLGETVTSGFEE